MTGEEIDKLIAQIKGSQTDAEPSREWSTGEIDRLIFGDAADENASFDDKLFTLKPVDELESEYEPEDIYSGSEQELDGQESLFDKVDDFKFEDLNLETVYMPDSVGQEDGKYAQVKTYFKNLNSPDKDASPIDKPYDFGEEYGFYKSEKESEPKDVPVDRSGFIITRGTGKADLGLEAMPKITSAQAALEKEKNKANNQKKLKPIRMEGQIMLSDFSQPDEDSMPKNSRFVDVEKNLSESRKQKINKFRLEGIKDDFREDFDEVVSAQPKTTEKAPKKRISFAEDVKDSLKIGEYTAANAKNAFNNNLLKMEKQSGARTIMSLIVLLVMGSCAIAQAAFSEKIEDTGFIFDIISLICLVFLGFMLRNKLFAGIKSILKLSPTPESSICMVWIFSVIYAVIAFFTDIAMPGAVICAALIVISELAQSLDITRILGNFSIAAFKYEHNCAVHAIENPNEIDEISNGSFKKDAKIYYSSSVEFPQDFAKNSSYKPSLRSVNTIFFISSILLSVITAIISKFFRDEYTFIDFLNVFLLAAGLSSPVFLKLIPSAVIKKENKKLNREGAMIASYKACEDVAKSSAVIVDAADLFDTDSCQMHGMNHYNGIRIDEVLFYAAAIVIKTGGPLKTCFEKIIDGQNDLLPAVKELTYEDKLGFSARINTEKVLFGNRNMLIHHNITPISAEQEKKYSRNGRKVLYLASNEKLAGMFVVSYKPDANVNQLLKVLSKNSIRILVRANDVNITQQLLADTLGMHVSDFGIMTASGYNIYKRRKDSVTDKLPCNIITDGTNRAMIKTVAACCKIAGRKKAMVLFQAVVSILGLALAGFFSSIGGIGVIFAILVMAAVTGIIVLI